MWWVGGVAEASREAMDHGCRMAQVGEASRRFASPGDIRCPCSAGGRYQLVIAHVELEQCGDRRDAARDLRYERDLSEQLGLSSSRWECYSSWGSMRCHSGHACEVRRAGAACSSGWEGAGMRARL